MTRAHGALLVVDAVASVGGHALDVDALGIDVAVIGPQKALGGQAGVSALSVSPAAWARMAPPGEAPSILSLADQRALWLETGRGALPGTPSALEFHALAQTLARVEAEGLAAIQARHRRAAAAARAGAKVLTGRDWVAKESASNLVTAAALPEGLDAAGCWRPPRPATPSPPASVLRGSGSSASTIPVLARGSTSCSAISPRSAGRCRRWDVNPDIGAALAAAEAAAAAAAAED